MKKILFVILLFVMGCSKNPMEPLPPIQHQAPSFEEHLTRLQTPYHTFFWVNNFAEYDMAGQLGWEWIDRGMPDLAYSLAYSMWETYLKGHNAGVCGQFAATFVVAARTHGYDCGFLVTYTRYSGHARGWIVEKDGTIWISDNERYLNSGHTSKEEFFRSFGETYFNNPDQYGYVTNDKLEVIFDADGYHSPTSLSSLNVEDRSRIVKSLGYSE